MEPINLPPIYVGEEPPPGDTAVSLPTPNANEMPLPPEVAQQRAVKTEQGLGQILGKTSQEIQQDFIAGRETLIRQQAAAALDVQNDKKKQDLITKLAQVYGPLSAEQTMKVMDPFNYNTDPDTVIEKNYAKSVIQGLATAPNFLGHRNLMDVAAEEIPKQAQEALDTGDDLITKNQYLLKKLQDAQQLAAGQSWLGWGVDLAKGLTQFYPEYKQRGLVDGIKFAGVGLGSNLEEQSNTLYRKPFSEFKKTVDAAYEYLSKDNPGLAVSFLSAMYGQDTFEKTANNIFTTMAIPDTAAIGAVAKKLLTYNQIRRAARDVVDAAARDPNATRANAVAATGDVGESAVIQVTDGLMKAVAGSPDPLATARGSLLSTWQKMAEDFSKNTGTYLSREEFTRIQDAIEADGGKLLNTITTMHRVERNPRALTEEVVRAYKDKIRNDLKGPNAMVIDVDGPFIEPASNTKWFRVRSGDYDGALFTNSETAEGRVVNQLGKGVVRGEEATKLYIPETAAKNLESVKTANGVTRFFVDHDIEVVSSTKPQPGFVPYNTKTGKFEKTVGQDERELLRLQAEKEKAQREFAKANPDSPDYEHWGPYFEDIEARQRKLYEGLSSAKIEQQGLGFYIEHWVPMNETDDMLRDLMIKDKAGRAVPEATSLSSATGSKSIINSILGWVRNSDETLAVNESIQRKAVVYAQNNVLRWAHELNKDINKLKGKGNWWKPTAYLGRVSGKDASEQFERTLVHAQQTESFFKNGTELNDFYQRSFHRSPSALETRAYFNYVKLIEGDRMLGEIAEFRNRARLGAERHRLHFIGPDGKPIYSDLFDGMALTKFPGATSDQMLFMNKEKGKETVKEVSRLTSKTRAQLAKNIEEGKAKVIEVYDMDHHPLANFSDVAQKDRIRFVYTESVESQPLTFNHVNRKEGGHFEWDYDHYLKQADIRHQRSGKKIYIGDTTVMPVKNPTLGGNVAKLFNEAHELMKADRWEEVRPIAAKLGIEYQQFTGWYRAGRDEAGRPTTPKLDFNEPIHVVPKGKNIRGIDPQIETRYKNFEDGSRRGPANNFKVAYNTERHTDYNFKTINDVGTQGNPLYAYQPANLIDPLTTMNRALNRAIKGAFVDDYKLYAIEHWLREAEPFLKNPKEARTNAFWTFNHPEYGDGVDKTKIWNLEQHRYKINTFIGVPSKFDTWVHDFTEHLANSAYSKYGPEENRTLYQKSVSIVPTWLLHRVTNPVDFIRSVTFNYKLGLLNPAQFLVQSQTHALIWSLEPRHGTVGTFGMMLYGWSRVNKNPAIMNSLDNYYTKLNMFGSKAKPGEFLEATRELDRTGFAHVAGEYENIAAAYTPTTNFIQSDIQKGLQIGQTPFRLGEQSTRITAWYTAFRKFREANPTTPIGNIERGKILNDADLLTVNMSRASSSALQHGVFSLSSQFLSYQIKLAELFWSKRIDNMARARIITGFGLLYGFPNAIGVTGAPINDNIRAVLLDNLGYIPGENWISTMVNEGYPSWAWAMITGKGDLQAGNVENVGNRFSSQGFQNVKQALNSSIPWWQAVGGAGVSTMSNFIGGLVDPFYQGAISWARGDSEDKRFQITAADLIEPWKQASVISQAVKGWTGIASGKWISTNEKYVSDVTPWRAAYLAFLGLSPQEQDDMFVSNNIIKGEKEAQDKAGKEATKDWHRGLEAFSNKDPEQGNAYIKNAMARLTAVGYRYEDILSWIAQSNKGWESSISTSDFSFWSTGDQTKDEQRLERYQRQLKLQEKRK